MTWAETRTLKASIGSGNLQSYDEQVRPNQSWALSKKAVQLIPLWPGLRLPNVYYVTCFTYKGTHNMPRNTAFLWLVLPYKYTPGIVSFLQFLLIRSTVCTGIRGLCNCVQACTDEDEKFGHLGCLTTSPGLTRSRGQSILLEPGKWFAFLNKSP